MGSYCACALPGPCQNRGAFCLRMCIANFYHRSNRCNEPALRVRVRFPPNFLFLFCQKNNFMKMAGFAVKCLFVVLVALLIVPHVKCVLKRSKEGCVICGRKSQPCNFQNADAYADDFVSCFGTGVLKETTHREICEGCRRAVQEYRMTGKTFHHVSRILNVCTACCTPKVSA